MPDLVPFRDRFRRLARDMLVSYGLTEGEIDSELSRGENAESASRMTIGSPGDGIVELLATRRGEAAKPWAVIHRF